MSRNKSNTKSGWQQRDKKYRLEQNARARRNRAKKLFHLLARWGV